MMEHAGIWVTTIDRRQRIEAGIKPARTSRKERLIVPNRLGASIEWSEDALKRCQYDT